MVPSVFDVFLVNTSPGRHLLVASTEARVLAAVSTAFEMKRGIPLTASLASPAWPVSLLYDIYIYIYIGCIVS